MGSARVTPEVQPCEKCGGNGLVMGEDGIVTRCGCGAWEELQRQERYRLAQIPPKFRNKSLKSFLASGSDPRRRHAKEFCQSYALGFRPGMEKGLFLRGNTGTGKTHLAVGILMEVLNNGHRGMYCNVTDLLDRLRGSYRQGSSEDETDILAEMEETDLLILDDLGAERATDWVRDRLYLIVNRRYENNKPLIVTTNCDSAELTDRVGPRIVSRLYEMCAPVDKFPEEDYRYAHLR